MIPRQAPLGRSFKFAGAYYLHDKGAETSERVAFTHTDNIATDDPQAALRWMAWTAMHAEDLKRASGAQANNATCGKPVFTLSLSFHPEQKPDKSKMVGAGRQALIALGLQEHETLMVGHRDTEHPHVHLIVNTVHPETGYVNRLEFSKLRLSKFAEQYEREHGKIYCEERVENNARREQGQKVRVHADLVTELYNASDNGAAFQAALSEHGFKLAQGRGKRILLIDSEGVVYNIARRIDGVKSKEIQAKIGDVKLRPLSEFSDELEVKRKKAQPHVAEEPERKPEAQAKQPQTPEYFDRDKQYQEFQDADIDAAIETAEAKSADQPPELRPRPVSAKTLNTLQDRHLEELGRFSTDKTLARLHLAAKLDEFYGENERRVRADIDHLENTLNNSSRLKLLVLRLTGKIPKEARQHLQLLRADLESVEWRKREATQNLEHEIQQERQVLEARHRRQREELQPPAKPEPDDQLPELDQPEAEEDLGPSLGY
ncbi:MAG TPA: relaxase/mobilization nuclease domain-containing protein [Bryobacteraceae bacterium]|jgi:hypothetical protein